MPSESRLKFGIKFLDDALNGGIPERNVVLISGGAGTGKSTLCLHFVLEGIRKDEKSIYISTEQTREEMERQTNGIEPNIKKMLSTGMLKFIEVDVLNEERFIEKIVKEIEDQKPKRIVIDSLSTFSEFSGINEFARELLIKRGGIAQRGIDQVVPVKLTEKTISKKLLGSLIAKLKKFPTTILLTSELPEKSETLSSDGISEFLSDGVIVLYFLGVGSSEFRSMQIRKMRYTGHKTGYLQYVLTSKGIEETIKNELKFD